MTHVDPELLALAALGEPLAADDAGHLDSCAECRAEVDSYAHAVTAGRAVRPDDLDLPAPPVSVWESIVAELGVADAPAPAAVRSIDSAPSRRHRPQVWLGVAAAVVVLALAVGVFALVNGGSDGSPVKQIALTQIDDSGVSGNAAIVRDGNGYALRVDTTGLQERDGSYYELWMMNPDTESFVSLGPVLPGQRSTHPLPAGVTWKTDPFVDISVEPLDGDPAHSTVSVTRGSFA
jgi:anti-sigma-K factor RskA